MFLLSKPSTQLSSTLAQFRPSIYMNKVIRFKSGKSDSKKLKNLLQGFAFKTSKNPDQVFDNKFSANFGDLSVADHKQWELRMPNEELDLMPLKEVRSKKRKAFGNTHPSVVYFQVVGSGTPGGTRSLFLYTDHQRYLFNCGEGTQRLCMEHCSTKALGLMGNIFLTSRTWQNLGGLLGMCLSMRAAGAPDVTIHGPKGCMDMYEATKSFIIMHEFNVIGHDVGDGIYDDNAVTIRHVTLTSVGEPIVPPEPKYSPWRHESSLAFTNKGTPINSGKIEAKEVKAIDQSVTAYILTVKSKPGKLMMEKCKGVPPGPLLGDLKAGRDIVLEDGTVVKASDVIDASTEKPQVFIVIECPSKDFFPSLLSSEKLKCDHPDLSNVQTIFHFTPSQVMEMEEYASWVNSFPETTKHVVLNDRSTGYGSRDVLEHNYKLHRICPQIFPSHLKLRIEDLSLRVQPKGYSLIKAQTHQAKSSAKVYARPYKDKLENDIQVELFDEQEAFADVTDLSKITSVQNSIKDLELLKSSEGLPQYPVVTFLGTGSSVPSKYRCVSSILVETEPDNFIILDCGEGTLLQIHRQLGREGACHVLRNLKAIYLSHLHADHHMGLINLILERSKAFKLANQNVEKMFVLAPLKITAYLSLYHHKFEAILTDLHQISNEHLLSFSPPINPNIKTQTLYPDVLKELLEGTGLQSIKTCRAVHCASSFSVALVTKAGFKIVYSGDTRPNEAIVQLGTDGGPTDLLIHEATMEHKMLDDCISKRHSTFTEAAAEGRAMSAKFTMLTHFSQRYCKLPILDEIEAETMTNLGIAFDGMSVNPNTFEHIRLTYPALRTIFAEAIRDMETRRANFSSWNVSETIAESFEGSLEIKDQASSVPKKKIKLGD